VLKTSKEQPEQLELEHHHLKMTVYTIYLKVIIRDAKKDFQRSVIVVIIKMMTTEFFDQNVCAMAHGNGLLW
jgi:hypothetical protein